MKITDTRLQNFRKILGDRSLRLTDIAEKLGKAPAQVSAFGGKNPTKGIGDRIAREIETALGLHTGYLDIPHPLMDSIQESGRSHGCRRLPVIGSLAAGSWSEEKNQSHLDTINEWIDAPGPVGSQAFIMRVEGISMEPLFFDGEKVVIDPSLEIAPGHFVLAKKISEKTATLKQFRKEGDEQYLFALNPNWPNRIIQITDEWKILGRARWKISDL